MKVQFATTLEELEEIIELRYQILRKPWNQSKESVTDQLENISHNAYLRNENNQVVGCGRLQLNAEHTGQIRYMAVANNSQGKGYGKLILQALEKKAVECGLKEIELQSRDNAVEFYKANQYQIVEKTFKLWDIIQHYLMRKVLNRK